MWPLTNNQPIQRIPFPLPVCPPSGTDVKQMKQFTQSLYKDFWNFSVDEASRLLEQKEPSYWQNQGERLALILFHQAAERVPAYKDFLNKNHIKHIKIKTIQDFQNVPTVDKKNYLEKYPLEALYFEGTLFEAQMVSVSSGSSGEPFLWPRGGLLEMETTYIQEMYLKKFFEIDTLSTLYIDSFAMGMYIAGPIILNSALRISQKGYPMMVITPGLSMNDIMRVLPKIGNKFDQIIIGGYPPFVKDIIEEGRQRGLFWKQLKPRLILAGEGFSEEWRDMVSELAGIDDSYNKIINIYGTADASIVGHETPESIILRRFINSQPDIQKKVFNSHYQNRLPTLVQYFPTQKYFEVVDQELHFTATSGIPLIRYNIHDNGGILPYDQITQLCDKEGFDIDQTMKNKPTPCPSWKLPFVYLYGRSDFTAVVYGANIYPENIKNALECKEVINSVTGRFTMSTEYNKRQDTYLLIHVELADGIANTKSLEDKIENVITDTLLRLNDEYRSSYQAKEKLMRPTIQLHDKKDQQFFNRDQRKQKWTNKK